MTTRCTVISLQVRVPVLSEQMTVTEPSVSTAESWRMMALCCAMRRTPSARVMVIRAGSPSGMAEAARATAIMNISARGWPRHSTPMAKVSTTKPTMTSASQWLKRAIWRSSGVVVDCTVASKALMRPSSVPLPVATTSPVAVPEATSVPEYSMPCRSPRGASSATAPACLSQGRDSPVSTASLARRPLACRMRRSAGTLSPEASSTTSPGTRVWASTTARTPPRSTVACSDSMRRMASSEDSALPSCKKPISALITTAPSSTPVSSQCPSAAVTTAATSIT